MTVLVGLMSGTSLDGISAAVVRFRDSGDEIGVELLAFLVHPYSAQQRDRLTAALTAATPREYARLDFELGAWLGEAAAAAMAEAGVARADIAAIASHGQTVWHDPPRATWQIGHAAVIAERTGVAVISDFRSRDVAAGGQGAPLVAIADAMLFSAQGHWRATLNLGGIANVQLLPPRGDPRRSPLADRLASVRAFDTGPGVGVIDAVVRAMVPSLAYDVGGALARGARRSRRSSTTCCAPRFLPRPRRRARAASCSRRRTSWRCSSDAVPRHPAARRRTSSRRRRH